MSDSRSASFSSDHLDWVDGTRSLAALAVVLLHAAAPAVTDHSLLGESAWWIANVLDSATRWCVPVFVMLSGALLLAPAQQAESWLAFYRRRFSRLLIPLVFWSGFYLAYDFYRSLAEGRAWNGEGVLHLLLAGKPYFHLWYLFMLPGLYLLAPLLRQLLTLLHRRQLVWCCTAILGLACANRLFTLTRADEPVFAGVLFLPYLGYFLAGYLFVSRPRATVWPWPVWLTSFAFTAMACGWLAAQGHLAAGLYFYDYFSVTTIPMGIATFALCMRLPGLWIFRMLAPLSLGIYLLHPMWLDIFWQLGWRPGTGYPALMIPLLALAASACSALCTALLIKIPGLRKTV